MSMMQENLIPMVPVLLTSLREKLVQVAKVGWISHFFNPFPPDKILDQTK